MDKRSLNIGLISVVWAPKKRKGKRYVDRWRREHPRATFYLDRVTYEDLKRLAESKNMSVKDLVLDLINGLEEYYDIIEDEGYNAGYGHALKEFHEEPRSSYKVLKQEYPDVEPALFTVPCSMCGKPTVFTHRYKNWPGSEANTLRGL